MKFQLANEFVPSHKNSLSPSNRIILALLSGSGLFLFSAVILLIGFQFIFLGRIFPGISISNIDLSGMPPSQAASIIAENLTFDTTASIVFQDGSSIYEYSPQSLGLEFYAAFNAQEAYKIGRQGWPWTRMFEQYNAFRSGFDLPPILGFNGPSAQKELEKIASQINQPVIEASLSIDGFNVQVVQGQIGRTVDIWASIALLSNQFMSMESGIIPLVVHSTPPAILDVSQQAEIARQILSAPLDLIIPTIDDTVLTLNQNTLAEILIIQHVSTAGIDTYQIGLDDKQMRAILASIASQLSQSPRNARFIFNDETRVLDLIESAITGYELNIDASLDRINQEISKGNHTVELVLDIANPEITDTSTAKELGIAELIQSQTTYFYGSSSGRMKNIQISAAQFHGLFIPPGEIFSMVENIGDISLDSGYAESLIIYGDRTIQGVGGGVCQVSTTLFRTVFFAGFPVVERYQHAYRVYYYELNRNGVQDSQFAGLDATLYTPLVDFKFKNDSQYWILMETYVNIAARSITWKFYSTSDGREVSWNTSGLTNVVSPPDPVYEQNDELKKGEVEQVDWAVEGADVRITRSVTRNGNVIFNDEFNTHYLPWAMVCQYGTNTKGYPPKKIDSDATSCELSVKLLTLR